MFRKKALFDDDDDDDDDVITSQGDGFGVVWCGVMCSVGPFSSGIARYKCSNRVANKPRIRTGALTDLERHTSHSNST